VLGMNLALAGVVVIGGSMVLAVAALLSTRRLVKMQLSDGHNDIAGFIFATVAVVYAVVLGFLVITVWQRFADAENAVTSEAASLVAVFRDTQTFPQPYRDEAQAALRSYATVVPASEWPTHGTLRPHTTPDPLNTVWNVFRAVKPATPEAESDLAQAKDHLSTLELMRHQTHLASEGTVPGIFWGLLIAGGIVTVGFTCFFQLDNVRVHAIMIAILAGGIAGLLFGVLALDRPFTGAIHISDYPFQHALQQFVALNDGSTMP
jgi:hypothetical protein